MAEFISSKDKVIQWKYVVSEFTIIYPTSTYNIPPERVQSISIDNNYEKNLFPIIRINTTIEPDIYKQMIANKNDLKVKLRIQKYYIDKTNYNEKSLLRDWINTTFALILDDEYLDPDRGIKDAEKENLEDPESKVNNLNYTMGNQNEFFLYKDETINAMRTNVNDVLQNTNMIGFIAYICAKSGVKNILVSPLENNKTYSELIIPPQSALSALQYFDTEYGFYRHGSMIYFGFDYAYILNYKGGCTAYVKDEVQETCIMIPQKGGSRGSDEGMLEKIDQTVLRNYILVRADHVNPKSESISNDIIEGNNATIINTNTNTITSTSGGTTQKGNAHSNIINSNSLNEFLGETYAAQKAANATVLYMATGDIDASAINPNKKITVCFEDSVQTNKYRGTYIISESHLKFIKTGNDLTLDTSFVLKRVNNDGLSVTSESTESEDNDE